MNSMTCPKCGAMNNWGFVMYYGDSCFNCDFDIREHMRKEWGWYGEEKKEKKTCSHCNAEVGELSVWCWLCGMEIKKIGGLEK